MLNNSNLALINDVECDTAITCYTYTCFDT